MANSLTQANPGSSTANFAGRLGFFAAALLAVVTAAAFAVAIATPPRSGPFCTASCMAYPYAGAAAFVPGDYRWVYLAILMMPLFVVSMACLHARVGEGRRVFSLLALCFSLISATLIAADYFIQVEVMQPSLLKGESEGLTLFSQYNPHGVFIALEDLGYLVMSAAFLFAGLAFSKEGGLQRALRWVLLIPSVLAFAAYLGMAMSYGINLDYRFEVTVITINWITLIVTGVMLSFWFRREMRHPPTRSDGTAHA